MELVVVVKFSMWHYSLSVSAIAGPFTFQLLLKYQITQEMGFMVCDNVESILALSGKFINSMLLECATFSKLIVRWVSII
jgi:hypothetical protein